MESFTFSPFAFNSIMDTPKAFNSGFSFFYSSTGWPYYVSFFFAAAPFFLSSSSGGGAAKAKASFIILSGIKTSSPY